MITSRAGVLMTDSRLVQGYAAATVEVHPQRSLSHQMWVQRSENQLRKEQSSPNPRGSAKECGWSQASRGQENMKFDIG